MEREFFQVLKEVRPDAPPKGFKRTVSSTKTEGPLVYRSCAWPGEPEDRSYPACRRYIGERRNDPAVPGVKRPDLLRFKRVHYNGAVLAESMALARERVALSRPEVLNPVKPEEVSARPTSEGTRVATLGPLERLYRSNKACCTGGQEDSRGEDAAAACRLCGHLESTNGCLSWRDQLGVLGCCRLGARNPTAKAGTNTKASAPPESRAAWSAAIVTQAAQRVMAAINVVTRGPAATAVAPRVVVVNKPLKSLYKAL